MSEVVLAEHSIYNISAGTTCACNNMIAQEVLVSPNIYTLPAGTEDTCGSCIVSQVVLAGEAHVQWLDSNVDTWDYMSCT